MATAMASIREQNLQKSILWMQQEHATTLRALHQEISHLQKKYSELTFKVAMDSTSVSREEFYQQKSEQLETDLKSERGKSRDLESELSKKDEEIKKLTDELSCQNRTHAEDDRYWKSRFSDLEKECSSQADTIVSLRTRQRAHKLHQSDACVSTEDHVPIIYSPVPPKESIKFRKTPFNRCSVAVNYKSHPVLNRHVVQRAASGCRLLEKPQSPDYVPDPTPFVRHSQGHDIKRAAKLVLPPISRKDSGSIQYYPIDSHRPDSQSSTSSAEIGTLAVDQVSEKKGFPRSRHFNRADCT